MTTAVPQQHITPCNGIDITAKIIVGTEDNLCILWETVNNTLSITTCHHHISQSLDGSCGIDIAHNLETRMLILELLQIFGTTGVSQ